MKKLFLLLAVAFMCCGSVSAWDYYYCPAYYYAPMPYPSPAYCTPYPVYGGYGWNPYYRTYQYYRPAYRYGYGYTYGYGYGWYW